MFTRLQRLKLLATATAALVLMGGLAASASAAGLSVSSVTPWLQNAAPVGWSSSSNRVVYNSIGSNGLFNAYSANPDGSDPQCITCALPSFSGVGTATNRGASDVSPDGRYVLVTVEEDHIGLGAAWTQPGKGGANDIWLYSADGSQAWPLTDINAPGQQALGTIWARFDRTGNEIVWASMYAPAFANLGYWQLKVANIVWSNGVPSLANVRTIEPYANSFYEPYGFTPDDSHILFASDADEPSVLDTQIDEIATDGSGFTQLTSPVPGATVSYNEFAFFTPDNSTIIYGSTTDAISGGMDYWTMNPDGSDQSRLTSFNIPWSSEALGYSITEGLAFNPNNPNQLITGVAADPDSQTVNAYVINLGAPAPAPAPAPVTASSSGGTVVAGSPANAPVTPTRAVTDASPPAKKKAPKVNVANGSANSAKAHLKTHPAARHRKPRRKKPSKHRRAAHNQRGARR